MRCSARIAGTVLTAIGLVGLLPASAAMAAPIDDLRAQAATLETQIAETGARVAALGEQMNAAQLAFDEAQAKISDAETRIAAARAESARLVGLVRDRMASIYRRHGLGPTASLDFSSATDQNIRSQYAEVATRRDNRLLDQLDAARKDLAIQRSDADRARAEAQTQRDALATTKAEADAAAAEQQGLLGQVQGELGALVRAEHVTTYGMPISMAAVAAACTSSGDDMVSIHATSAPPSFRPRISSLNDATASVWLRAPIGSNSSPVGPTEPATTTGRSAPSATLRANSAAVLASS